MTRRKLAIDFDHTCVKKAPFPHFGSDNELAVQILRLLSDEGVELILWTCRGGEALENALKWFEKHNIVLSDVNGDQKCDLIDRSVKIDCDYYIDDKALGCPTQEDGSVDWLEVWNLLIRKGYI